MTILINPGRAISVVLAAVALSCMVGAPGARAGSYHAWECAGAHGGPSAGADVGNNSFGHSTGDAPGYTPRNDCSNASTPGPFVHSFGIQVHAGATPGSYRAFDIIAPHGTRFLSGSAELNLYGIAGHQPIASIGNQSTLQSHIATSTDGWQNLGWVAPDSTTNQFVLWMTCASATGCPVVNGYSIAYARNLVFNVHDYTAPEVEVSGSLVNRGWRNSGGTLDVSGWDGGSGVYFLDHLVNGVHVRRDYSDCSLTTLWGTWVGTRLTPCETSSSDSHSFGLGAFREGRNTYLGCAYDFAGDTNYNGSCGSTTIYIDTVAPAIGGGGVALEGGTAWRPDNDFDVNWSNPTQPDAPIDGAYYRITKTGGAYDSGAQFVSGSNRDSLDDLEVPSAGEYQLKVWTRDEAGNAAESHAETTTLRYDPTVPPAREAEFNGWVRRNDFTYSLKWDPIAPNQVGPSGVAGYAVRVTRSPDSDPCVTGADPSARCSSDEINNRGAGDIEMPVSAADVSEGEWWAHVVPVTGAGVKAASVRHTPMPIDQTDPVSVIGGADGPWTNREVTLAVTSSDALSGMSPSSSHPMDPQPRTCLQIDDGSPDCEPDASVTRVVSDEGNHRVAYFGRDLAGNENDGRADSEFPAKINNPPGVATVRIDKTAPVGAFASARDVEDPTRIVVGTFDRLSGVVAGSIEMRRAGSDAPWSALGTSLEGTDLVARVSDDAEPGRYEMRATIVDRAGNSAWTDRRADGSPMVERFPLKEQALLSASVEPDRPKDEGGGDKGKGKKCKGKKRPGKGKKCKGKRPKDRAATPTRVPYGTPMTLAGVLRTADDEPLAARELVVTELMGDGADPSLRTRSTTTDAHGAYSIGLDAGPSRRVKVAFAGDARYRAVESDPVDVAVRAKVLRFKSTRVVPETKPIKFRGRVGTAGVALGPQGKRLELEYQKGHNWKTIDTGQTRPNGSFRLKYGLRSNYLRKTRVRFRVSVPPEGNWPYAGVATSRPRKTVILP